MQDERPLCTSDAPFGGRDDLTPGMRKLLQGIDRVTRTPFHEQTVQAARAAYERAAEVLDLPRAPLPVVQALALQRRDGSTMDARLYKSTADSAPLPVLLYLHGGGFTVGSLAVGGDSAGGTLVAVCALMCRDAGMALRLQLLITPGTTAYADTPSHQRYGTGYLLDAQTIEWFFAHYIDRDQRSDWRFAPLGAEDLEGVAPAALLLAECDPLVDEGLAYADRLRWSGVCVDLELVRGVVHDFIKMGRALPEARHALDWCAQALRRAWLTHTPQQPLSL